MTYVQAIGPGTLGENDMARLRTLGFEDTSFVGKTRPLPSRSTVYRREAWRFSSAQDGYTLRPRIPTGRTGAKTFPLGIRRARYSNLPLILKVDPNGVGRTRLLPDRRPVT